MSDGNIFEEILLRSGGEMERASPEKGARLREHFLGGNGLCLSATESFEAVTDGLLPRELYLRRVVLRTVLQADDEAVRESGPITGRELQRCRLQMFQGTTHMLFLAGPNPR